MLTKCNCLAGCRVQPAPVRGVVRSGLELEYIKGLLTKNPSSNNNKD